MARYDLEFFDDPVDTGGKEERQFVECELMIFGLWHGARDAMADYASSRASPGRGNVASLRRDWAARQMKQTWLAWHGMRTSIRGRTGMTEAQAHDIFTEEYKKGYYGFFAKKRLGGDYV